MARPREPRVIGRIWAASARPSARDPMSLLRHPDLFDLSPIPIVCEDWSGVRAEVMTVLASGVIDFDQYLIDHPDFVSTVRQRHAIVDANPRAA